MLLDHLVLFVDNLKTATTQFESKGFTVTPGVTNGPTHNAFIVFSNDTYIELIALQSSRIRLLMQSLRRAGVLAVRRWLKRDLQTRLLDWMFGPEGLLDLRLRGAELNDISISSPLFDIGLTDPVQFKRHRPDGLVFEWTLRGANNRRQPFFIQDATPIFYRIPTGDARIHPNGALRIAEIRAGELIAPCLSNVRITHNPALHLGPMSVTIVTKLEVTDHIQGPDFFNADIHLSPKPSD